MDGSVHRIRALSTGVPLIMFLAWTVVPDQIVAPHSPSKPSSVLARNSHGCLDDDSSRIGEYTGDPSGISCQIAMAFGVPPRTHLATSEASKIAESRGGADRSGVHRGRPRSELYERRRTPPAWRRRPCMPGPGAVTVTGSASARVR